MSIKIFNTLTERNDKITVITHDGKFHVDEIMACAILSLISDIDIIRSRNDAKDFVKNIETNIETISNQQVILVDVGGLYIKDHAYDHHMKNFYEQRDGVKYSSAGLIWNDFGEKVVLKLTNSSSYLSEVVKSIDEMIIQGIDAVDNGQTTELGWNMDKHIPTLASIVSATIPFDITSDKDELNSNFKVCVEFCSKVLKNLITKINHNLNIEYKFLENLSKSIINDNTLIVDDHKFVGFNWGYFCKKYQIETAHIKLCVFSSGKNEWRVQTLPEDYKVPFSMKCPAPEEWRGLSGIELQNKCCIDDAVFVHAGGFIGGTTTQDSAIQLAKAWIAKS
jgi:uncharacterized UPF0160 family protein